MKGASLTLEKVLNIVAHIEIAEDMDVIAVKVGAPQGELRDHLLERVIRAQGRTVSRVGDQYLKIREKIRKDMLKEMERNPL